MFGKRFGAGIEQPGVMVRERFDCVLVATEISLLPTLAGEARARCGDPFVVNA